MTYKFVQGIDYGPRKGTLGLEFHMAEGGDGTVGYLARHAGETTAEWHTRIRGVSAHVVIRQTGEVVQMVDFDNASGNVNPADRSTDKGYYGHSTLVAVLGDHWPDPNAWSISTEICGFASQGPNTIQITAAMDWADDMKHRYPSLRGAWGHADQTDTKPCPGTSAGMKALFIAVGGHGLWTAQEEIVKVDIDSETPLLIDIPVTATIYDLDGKPMDPSHLSVAKKDELSVYGNLIGGVEYRYITTSLRDDNELAMVKASQISNPRPVTFGSSVSTDCTPAIDAALADQANKIRAVLGA